MSDFDAQNRMAEKILTEHRGKTLAIVKATRAGATFSLLKKACELKQKTVIVAPYIEIFNKTVNEVADSFKTNKPRIARIAKNEDTCRRVAEKLEEHASLRELPFHFRPPCKRCKYNKPEFCRLQEILSSDWDVLGLTYAKLRALHMSESETTHDILEKIRSSDNLILDEFTTGIVVAASPMNIQNLCERLDNEFDISSRILEAKDPELSFWSGISYFAEAADGISRILGEKEHMIREDLVNAEDGDFFRENFPQCWHVVEQLTIEGKDTSLLQQITQIITATRFLISKREGKVSLTPIEGFNEHSRRSSYLKDAVSKYLSKDKLVALVDACLPELDFKDALGVAVESFAWGDPLNTSKSQFIVCDTRKIGVTEFFKKKDCQPDLKKLINFASKIHKPSTILIVTLNKRMASVVRAWQESKEIPDSIDVTYYRSEFSRGITIDPKHRILILIGAPYLPKIAYLAEAYGTNKLAAFRKSDMMSAFINLIGRVKDPKGEEKSVVYASGITADEVKAFTTQEDIPSPLVGRFFVRGVDSLDFQIMGNLFLHSSELREEWTSLEKDLPVMARILRVCRYRNKEMLVSDVIPNQTERVQQFVDSYPDVLKQFNIEVIRGSRGSKLVPS